MARSGAAIDRVLLATLRPTSNQPTLRSILEQRELPYTVKEGRRVCVNQA